MENSMQTLLYKIGELQKKQIIKQTEVKRRGEDFNVFNVLGLWSEEVRLHSAMLAELLNLKEATGVTRISTTVYSRCSRNKIIQRHG